MSGGVERVVKELTHVAEEIIEKLPHGHGTTHHRISDDVHAMADEVDAAETKVAGAVPHEVVNRVETQGPHGPANNEHIAKPTFEDAASWRGLSRDAVRKLIPDDWGSKPLKKGHGTRHADPTRDGDSIFVEDGVPGHPDPVHSGPYVKVSIGGRTERYALEGNPTLNGVH